MKVRWRKDRDLGNIILITRCFSVRPKVTVIFGERRLPMAAPERVTR